MKFALIVSSVTLLSSCSHLMYENLEGATVLSHYPTAKGGKKHHQYVAHMNFYEEEEPLH